MRYSLPCFHLAVNKAQAASLHSQAYMLISAAAQRRARMHYCQNGIGQITVSNCGLLSLSKGDKCTNKEINVKLRKRHLFFFSGNHLQHVLATCVIGVVPNTVVFLNITTHTQYIASPSKFNFDLTF